MNSMQSDAAMPLWLIPVILGLFAGIWTSVCAILSLAGGWHRLAKQFRSDAGNPGKKFKWVSGAVGLPGFPVSYRNCLNATVGEGGLGLRVLFLFRPLHPPLLIPWGAIETVTSGRLLVTTRTVITLRGFIRRITLYGAVGDEVASVFQTLQPASSMAWPASRP